MSADTSRWHKWYAGIRQQMLSQSFDMPPDKELYDFFSLHYTANTPRVLKLPATWPYDDWTMAGIRARAPNAVVQVQMGREADPDFELNSPALRREMPFYDFLDLIDGKGNDAYMTAQNSAKNTPVLNALLAGLYPLPLGISSGHNAHLWLGGQTMTPLHHDLTNNLMAQVMGRKLVRLVSPQYTDSIDYLRHVFSDIKWLTEEIAAKRGIVFHDVILWPGDALFLPCGWWHCCRALETSATVLYTTFHWPNNWTKGF